MNGAALQHKGSSLVECIALGLSKGCGKGIVLLVVRVKAVYIPTPSVKAPVDAAHLATFYAIAHYKRRANIARPAVIRGDIHKLHIG